MIVGVTMRVTSETSYVESRDAVSHDWTRLLATLGVMPVFIPNVAPDPSAYLDRLPIAALILTGGNDLADLSQNEGGPSDPVELRDHTETSLLEAAISKGLPVLGVCRGMQVVARYFGSALSDTKPNGLPHVGVPHDVTIERPALGLEPGATLQVNSWHRFVVSDPLAEPLQAFAFSRDGSVEGLMHSSLPIFAVQWHPERPNPSAEADDLLLRRWLSCAT